MQKSETFSLTGFELFIILILMMSTIALLVSPGPSFTRVHSAVWYVPLLALIPGFIYTLIYQSLITNSPYPLPRMLEHYWGKVIGLLLGLLYAWFFFTQTAVWVRLFLDFQLTAINPMQPISVLVAGILIVALYGLKRGFTTTVRALEIIFGIVVLFQIFLVLMGFSQADFSYLRPLYHTTPMKLASTTLFWSRFYTVAGLSLILAYFVTDKSSPHNSIRHAIFITGIFLTITTAITLGVVGNLTANDAYPIFDMVRRLRVGTFIRNMDAFFIAIWFVGVFFGIFTLWFAFIFTLQQMFRLSDYRPLAPATIIMIGIMAVALGHSSIEVTELQFKVMYPLLLIFLAGIPFLTWVIGLIRGKIKLKPAVKPNSNGS